MSVSPFCCVFPVSFRISSWCSSSFRVRIRFALADRLHLGPAQRHARLVLLEQEIVTPRHPVLGGVACPGSHRIAWFGLRRGGFYRMAGGSGHIFDRKPSSYIVATREETPRTWVRGEVCKEVALPPSIQQPKHAGVRYYTRHGAGHSSIPGKQGPTAPAWTIPSPNDGAA
jgi:hypothetical protein